MVDGNGITVKGTKDGLMLHIDPEIPLDEILSTLKEKFSSDTGFFQDADMVIDLGSRPFQEGEFHSFFEIFQSYEIRVNGILSDNPITKLLAQEEGIALFGDRSIMGSRVRVDHPVKVQRMRSRAGEESVMKVTAQDVGLFVRKTVRNGQKVHFAGDIMVLGDVNPGAEIMSTGNIVVFGSLRGVARAGAEGNQEAVVAALDLRPTQLRIADCIGRSSGHGEEENSIPEVASIQDGHIVIEPYEIYQNETVES